LDTLQVVGARFVSAFVLGFVFSNPLTRPHLFVTARPVLQICRGLLLLATTIFNFLAFRFLQLDEALVILFSTPFLVAIMAGPLLDERVGWRRWLAIGAGFVGVLMVLKPGIDGMQWAGLLSLAAALFYASYSIATRMAARSDGSETSLFYANFISMAAILPVMPFVWSAATLFDIALMLATGGFGALGHYLLIAGHRLAPASLLSPFMYTQLVWATLLGYVVFGNVPNRWTLAGAAVVVASGIYLLYREQRAEDAVAAVKAG